MRMASFVLTTVLMLVLCFAYAMAIGNGMMITMDKAIEIANKEAKALKYDVLSMKVRATKYSTRLNDYLPAEHDEYSKEIKEYYNKIRDKLENKVYWAVYYYDSKYQKGGDLCIFIDSSNGDVLAYISGK